MGEEAVTFALSAQSGGDTWFNNPEWAGIFAALLLGLAGIFQQEIRGFFFGLNCACRFNLSLPIASRLKRENRMASLFATSINSESVSKM